MARLSVVHSVLAFFLLLFLVLLKEKRDLVLSHVQIVLQDHRFRTYVCTHQMQRLSFAILLLLFVLVLYICMIETARVRNDENGTEETVRIYL
jgi:uncharacterized membrane protein